VTKCQHCHRPNDLYLCHSCQIELCNRLDQIPWLLEELDNRIQKLDRVSVGTIGRNRRPDEMNPVDFDAIELARTIRKTLQHWVETIATQATGRPPTALTTVTTPDLARWLNHNIKHIARLDLAKKGRHQLYDDITRIAGTPDRGGQLHRAINPAEHHLVGPCPTILGRDEHGHPRQCGRTLFADTYDRTVECPNCHQTIDVETTRTRAAAERDHHTRTALIDVMATIDEPITDNQLDAWINARRLRTAGWLHDGSIIEFRLAPTDEPVYSLTRARKLRRRDNNLTRRKITRL
jgi:uncharacterized Zn finger protein (UPF0148 family)